MAWNDIRVTEDRVGCDRFGCVTPIKAGESLREQSYVRADGTAVAKVYHGTKDGRCTGFQDREVEAIGRGYIAHVRDGEPAPEVRAATWQDAPATVDVYAILAQRVQAAIAAMVADGTLNLADAGDTPLAKVAGTKPKPTNRK
jgi:hypothetical protein